MGLIYPESVGLECGSKLTDEDRFEIGRDTRRLRRFRARWESTSNPRISD
jgi:hypothetical protein